MSSLELWSDSKAGVTAEWQKHAYPVGAVGPDGYVQAGYVVEVLLDRGEGFEPKAKSIRCKDERDAVATAYKKAKEIHTKNVLGVLEGGSNYESPELGLTVNVEGGKYTVAHHIESKVPGKRGTQVIAVFDNAKAAAKLAGLVEVEVAEAKHQLSAMAKNGEIPLDVKSDGELHDHFDANFLVEEENLKGHGIGKGAPDEEEALFGVHNAIHRGIDLWLREEPLRHLKYSQRSDGSKPWEIVAAFERDGAYEHPEMAVSIDRRDDGYGVTYHHRNDDGVELDTQVIAFYDTKRHGSQALREAAKLVKGLEDCLNYLKIDVYAKGFGGVIPAETASVDELHKHIDAKGLARGRMEEARVTRMMDTDDGRLAAVNAVLNGIHVFLRSGAFTEAMQRDAAKKAGM